MKTPPDLVDLDLARHCVETAVRRRYEAAIRTYFQKPGERRHLDPAIELLRQALETLDFPALRALHPALAGKTGNRVAIGSDGQGRLTIVVDGRPLKNLPLK